MTADQPLVTHADLGVLQHLRIATGPDFEDEGDDRVSTLLDRLIAHAEADKPALPEGWVQVFNEHGHRETRWHYGEGRLGFSPERGSVATTRDYSTVTPLVTAASLVPEGWHVDEDGDGRPTVWDADDDPLLRRRWHESDPAFDVLAALVTAAQAERGESR